MQVFQGFEPYMYMLLAINSIPREDYKAPKLRTVAHGAFRYSRSFVQFLHVASNHATNDCTPPLAMLRSQAHPK
ncbi:unnamed protein product [Somion occarium]|uniref:Uncharacterized protein n=1 Tax=Somion occarium TaxID=3059160 RepID=A0ABP1CSK6_9APHY